MIVEIAGKTLWKWKYAVLGWDGKSFITSFHPTKTFKTISLVQLFLVPMLFIPLVKIERGESP